MFFMALTSAAPPDDQEFLIKLYQDYHLLMFSTAGKYTSNAHDKEEIVQSALVKLVENVDRLRTLECCALTTFVVILTRNVAINYLRHLNVIQKHAYPLSEQDSAALADDFSSLDELVILRDRVSALERIWPQLSEQEQLLLSGKYILGLSDAELAQLVGCKSSSVRMKLTRARRNALYKMRENGDGYDKS